MCMAYAHANGRIRIGAYGVLYIQTGAYTGPHMHPFLRARINAWTHPDMINHDKWMNWCNTCIHTWRHAYITYISHTSIQSIHWHGYIYNAYWQPKLPLPIPPMDMIWSVSAFASHSGAVVRSISAWFSSALYGNLLLGTACFLASTDVKDLSVLFGHSSVFFWGGWKPSRFAADTSLKTFQTVALSCAKIWGRFPDVCVDEDYLALKRIPSWSVQCCCKSTIWKMPWYLNSKNCTQTETDLSDPVTLFYRME